MGLKNRIHAGYLHYLTLTVIDWVDIFTRPAYRHLLLEALKHYQQQKGLEVYAWCLMSNHLHVIAAAKENYRLSYILRDFKKHTSRIISEAILKDENESRRYWMLHRFAFAGAVDPKTPRFKIWQENNASQELTSSQLLEQKLTYIHQNPVRAEIVAEPEHYLYSSAVNYAGKPGLLEVLGAE